MPKQTRMEAIEGSVRSVLARGREVRKCNPSITSIPTPVQGMLVLPDLQLFCRIRQTLELPNQSQQNVVADLTCHPVNQDSKDLVRFRSSSGTRPTCVSGSGCRASTTPSRASATTSPRCPTRRDSARSTPSGKYRVIHQVRE